MNDILKRFKKFIQEAVPTNSSGSNPQGFSQNATAAGPVAGFDKFLFPSVADDLLSQDYQTPGQSGLAKWRFAGVYPVQPLTMKGIDSQVAASNRYTDIMDEQSQNRVRKNFRAFIEEAAQRVAEEKKSCPPGQYYCYDMKKCRDIPRGYHVGRGGYLEPDENGKKNGNGNGNGSNNGNGSSNGNGGGHSGGNGNGGGGNGGGGE